MTTQISFTADQDLKDRALEKAKHEGITLKALLTYAMKSFVEGKIALDLAFVGNMPNLVELKTNEVSEELLNKAAAARKLKKKALMNIQ